VSISLKSQLSIISEKGLKEDSPRVLAKLASLSIKGLDVKIYSLDSKMI